MNESLLPRAALALVATCLLAGCSLAGAPSLELFGAYFPAWLLCALLGTVGALGTAAVLARYPPDVIPLPRTFCAAVGVIAGLLARLALFR